MKATSFIVGIIGILVLIAAMYGKFHAASTLYFMGKYFAASTVLTVGNSLLLIAIFLGLQQK